MTNNYSSNLDFIAHAGRGHDDNPPGRGSGRYAWGSGAKWGKTSLGRSTNRVKKFFGKNRVEKSDAEREVNTSAGGTSSGEMTAAQKANAYQDAVKNDKYQLDFLEKIQNVEDIDDAHRLSEYKKYLNNPNEYRRPPEDLMYREAESHEANRKAALESGDRNLILKYFQESSNEELQRAITKAGMMDTLNKSISDSKPKIQSAEDLAKTQKEEYIKAALASGDKKRIFSVASDPSVTNNDLINALNKVYTIDNLNKQVNPSKFDKTVEIADKLKSVLDKGLGYYNTTSNVWNIIAANYNNSQTVKDNPTKALGYMMQIPNLNQKKDVKKS